MPVAQFDEFGRDDQGGESQVENWRRLPWTAALCTEYLDSACNSTLYVTECDDDHGSCMSSAEDYHRCKRHRGTLAKLITLILNAWVLLQPSKS